MKSAGARERARKLHRRHVYVSGRMRSVVSRTEHSGATFHVDRRYRPAALESDRPGARPSGGRLKAEPTRNRWPEEMYRHPLDTDTARDGRRKRPARSSGLIGAAPTRLAAGPNAGPWRSLLATPTRIRALHHQSGLTDPRDPVAPPHGRRPAAMLLAKYGDARSS